MTYQCIKCGREWIVYKASRTKSHGLCRRCITDYIREKQKNEGNHDCFNRATEDCDEPCKYHDVCCKDFLD